MKKQSKKFVLAGVLLLAVTGLLALTGCKNDTVPEPTRYTVKFETAHGTVPADITVESGTKLTAEQLKGLADTADYIFEGWYDGENKAEGGTYTVTKDVTLVAKWRERGVTAEVSFSVDENGRVVLSSEIRDATIYYTTDGTEPKESSDEYTKPIEISSETIIKAYAQGAELKPSDVVEKTYLVVTFDTDGKDTKTETVESGQQVAKPEDPTKDGWMFLGWYEDSGLANEFNFSTPVTADITLYAAWNGVGDDGNIVLRNKVMSKTSEVQVLSGEMDLSILDVEGSNSEVFISGRSGTIQPFVMGQYEVTQQLYSAVMGSNPSNFTSDVATGETQALRPVECVSWYDAVVFCNELSELMGLEPVYSKDGKTDTSGWGEVPTSSSSTNDTWKDAIITCDFTKSGYRLPTEAERELAARGGDPKAVEWKYTYAGSVNNCGNVAWYSGNSSSKTHEVGTKASNSLGLYDMSGNVREWCWDRWSDPITAATPSDGVASGYDRVIRGGDWQFSTTQCKVSDRNTNLSGYDPYERKNGIGFRLVRSAN